jgi:hypothetical protein
VLLTLAAVFKRAASSAPRVAEATSKSCRTFEVRSAGAIVPRLRCGLPIDHTGYGHHQAFVFSRLAALLNSSAKPPPISLNALIRVLEKFGFLKKAWMLVPDCASMDSHRGCT